MIQWGLFDVVNRYVLQEKTVEVFADGGLNLLAELNALGEEFVELHLFAGGLEGFGEFRFKQLAELFHVGNAL